MVETRTLAIAGGALLASEAMGVTSFTGGATRGAVSPEQISRLVSDQVSADVGNQVTESVSNAIPEDSGMDPSTIAALMSANNPTSGGGGGSGSTTIRTIVNKGKETTEKATEEVSDTASGTTQMTERMKELLEKYNGPNNPGSDDTSNNDNSSSSVDLTKSDRFDLQDTYTGGSWTDGLAIAGEAGNALGDTADTAIDTMTKSGNSIAQATRALAGKEYDTNNTLYGERTGDKGKKRIYEGSLVDKASKASHEAGQVVNDIVPGTPAAKGGDWW